MSLDMEKIKELETDIMDRIENLAAIKGETFAIAVRATLSMNNILRASLVTDVPQDTKTKLMIALCGIHTGEMLTALGIKDEDRAEIVEMARSIDTSIRHHAQHIIKREGD